METAGFPVLLDEDGTLSSFFALEREGHAFAFTAECLEDDRPQSHAGVKGVIQEVEKLGCEAKVRFYEGLLAIPANYRVSIGLDKDIVLVYFPPGDLESAYTYIGSTFALATNIAGWMIQAFESLKKGGEVPEFKPEIIRG